MKSEETRCRHDWAPMEGAAIGSDGEAIRFLLPKRREHTIDGLSAVGANRCDCGAENVRAGQDQLPSRAGLVNRVFRPLFAALSKCCAGGAPPDCGLHDFFFFSVGGDPTQR